MCYATLATDGRRGVARDERLTLFVAGDDAEAKHLIGKLIDQLG